MMIGGYPYLNYLGSLALRVAPPVQSGVQVCQHSERKNWPPVQSASV